jgi:hypothetical protein
MSLNMIHSPNDGELTDIIYLNVLLGGGTKDIAVLRSTLASVEGFMCWLPCIADADGHFPRIATEVSLSINRNIYSKK